MSTAAASPFASSEPLSGAFRDAVSDAITAFLDTALPKYQAISPMLESTCRLAREFTAGGKRLRPAFGYWGWVAAAGQPADPAVLVSTVASLELLHASALVHDDVMDAANTRRGRPTVHRQFEQLFRDQHGRGDAESFGRAGAILLGDQLLVWHTEMAATSGFDSATLARGAAQLLAVRSEVLAGQLLDIHAQAGLGTLTDQVHTANQVVEYKTARYTVQRPAQWGAALGGGSPELVDALGRFGLPIGRAFQLRDDLLDLFGDPAITGKASGGDLREGKRTVLVAEALAASAPGPAAELEQLLGRPDLTDSELDRARDIITAAGARERVEALIGADHRSALAVLAKTDLTAEGRTALTALAKACVERNS